MLRLPRQLVVCAWLACFSPFIARCLADPQPDPVLLAADASGNPVAPREVRPLDALVVEHLLLSARVTVTDSAGRVYAQGAGPRFGFTASGAAGRQTIAVASPGMATRTIDFTLVARTEVSGDAEYTDMFRMFLRGMTMSDDPRHRDEKDWLGDTVQWRGRSWHMFVSWVLDHYHNSKGMRYFSPWLLDFPELMRDGQREDGLIWSNINENNVLEYYKTEYGPLGYIREIDGLHFVRQPSENHPEYNYVDTIYLAWKSGASDAWVRTMLASAARALDYSVTDESRWSKRFELLKRVYTIDSWDFQVDDAYTPDIGLAKTMVIDPRRSKFGVFFGDNVYYAASCDELAEMMDACGDAAVAAKYRQRAADIRRRIDALSWNGRYFRHFVEEDPTVRRDLGVDEASQIAQGNAYALNCRVSDKQAAAILDTYRNLRNHLPAGSPGEWYAIYPPFERGFEKHGVKWQYMNGGVGGHVAGELARGAFAHGDDAYGRDILDRLHALGTKHGGRIYFAYTGAYPPAPTPRFEALPLGGAANMSLHTPGRGGRPAWLLGARPGDDFQNLPTGLHTYEGVPYDVPVPEAVAGGAAVAVSHRAGLPSHVAIPVARKVGSVYLLHTATKPQSESICGAVAFQYADGTEQVRYIASGKQLTYWWFPSLATERSGVAWRGPNAVSTDVGLSWCAIDNPQPDRPLRSIELRAPEGDGIYAVAALTLSDLPHHVAAPPVSFGGPDNWASATAMAAFVEGLLGVRDEGDSRGLAKPVLSPRLCTDRDVSLRATVALPVSGSYLSFEYNYHAAKRFLSLRVAGGGTAATIRLPTIGGSTPALRVDGSPVATAQRSIGPSLYSEAVVTLGASHLIEASF